MAKRDEQKVTAAPVDKGTAVEGLHPPEESAALALRGALAQFNAGANDRSVLTRSDREALENIKSLCDTYIAAANLAWSGNEWGSTQMPETITRELAEGVIEYVRTSAGTMRVEVAHGESSRMVETPAIESATIRGLVARTGAALLVTIDKAIAEGHKRIAAAKAAEQKLTDGVRYWLARPVVRHLVEAMILIMDQKLGEQPFSLNHVLDALRQVQIYLRSNDERAGSNPPEPLAVHVGFWRRWMPFARTVLAESKVSS